MSLFTRPVTAGAVLVVAGHEAFGERLAGWTEGMVQDAVREQLAGLASWHPDATISAHPLVRDTFRPVALPAAATAAETSLTGLPEGTVTSRAQALRVTEAIELLLDADQWQPADDLYRSRSDSSQVWKNLPAARLGQRTATAFVATAARRDDCATHLTPDRLSWYLNETGLYAVSAGDLATARDYLTLGRPPLPRRRGHELSGDRLAESGRVPGPSGAGPAWPSRPPPKPSPARTAADARDGVRRSHAYLGWLAGLAGDTAAAEDHFTAADQSRLADGGEAPVLVRRGAVGPVAGPDRAARPGPGL